MSRIGKQPIVVADKVEVVINGLDVKVKGPKGELAYSFTDFVKIVKEGNSVIVTPKDESNTARAMWGTTRTVINNMVVGVNCVSNIMRYDWIGFFNKQNVVYT